MGSGRNNPDANANANANAGAGAGAGATPTPTPTPTPTASSGSGGVNPKTQPPDAATAAAAKHGQDKEFFDKLRQNKEKYLASSRAVPWECVVPKDKDAKDVLPPGASLAIGQEKEDKKLEAGQRWHSRAHAADVMVLGDGKVKPIWGKKQLGDTLGSGLSHSFANGWGAAMSLLAASGYRTVEIGWDTSGGKVPVDVKSIKTMMRLAQKEGLKIEFTQALTDELIQKGTNQHSKGFKAILELQQLLNDRTKQERQASKKQDDQVSSNRRQSLIDQTLKSLTEIPNKIDTMSVDERLKLAKTLNESIANADSALAGIKKDFEKFESRFDKSAEERSKEECDAQKDDLQNRVFRGFHDLNRLLRDAQLKNEQLKQPPQGLSAEGGQAWQLIEQLRQPTDDAHRQKLEADLAALEKAHPGKADEFKNLKALDRQFTENRDLIEKVVKESVKLAQDRDVVSAGIDASATASAANNPTPNP